MCNTYTTRCFFYQHSRNAAAARVCYVKRYTHSMDSGKVVVHIPLLCFTIAGGVNADTFVAGDIQAFNDNQNPMFDITVPGQSPAGTTDQAINQGNGTCVLL